MAKRGKKYKEVSAPQIQSVVQFTAEQQETHYNRDYEFNKRVPVRSPIDGWEYKYTTEGQSNSPSKEIALVKGTSYKPPHRRDGNSYGNRPTRRTVKPRNM